MRRIVSIILSLISCLLLVASAAFCFYGIYDIHRTRQALSVDPSASGIDFLGVGWGYGIGLFFLSLFGLALTMVNTKLLKEGRARYCSLIGLVLFGMLTAASFCLFVS